MKNCRVCDEKLVVGENFTQLRADRYDWSCRTCFNKLNNKSQKAKLQRMRDASQPGVYGIYYGEELVYIGESSQCEFRFWDHKYTSPSSRSFIGLNKSYIKDYTLNIFKREEDLRLRRQLEMELIVKYKPKLNYPYREDGYIHNPK